MAKLSILAGATSQTVNIFIQDSSSTTGAGLTGLVFNTASLTAYYAFPRAAAVAITLATLAAVTSAWSSGGFKEIDATNMPGWYRFDIPNAALAAASGRFVSIHLKGATNMAPLPLEIELTGWDNQDAVRGGMTALPNAAAEAAGGLYTRGTGAGQINQQANGQIDANVARWLNTAPVTPLLAGVPIVDPSYVLRRATAQAGAASTITLDASANATDNYYRGSKLAIIGGTGAGQARVVTAYVGATKVATVSPAWITNPDVTSVFEILPIGSVNVEAWESVVPSALNSGLVQTDVERWANGAVPAPTVTGVPIIDLKYILGTLLTETAGQIAAAFKKVFDVATPVFTAQSVNQTGDNYPRLGAPAGASVSADVAAVKGDTASALTRLPAALVAGRMDSSVGAMATDTLTSGALATSAVTEIADGILDRDMSVGTDSGSTTVRTVRQALRFLRNKWTAISGALTVYKEDDTATSWTATLTTDATAQPIIGNDPAG